MTNPNARARVVLLMDTNQQRRVLDAATRDLLASFADVVRTTQNRPLVEEEVAELLDGADACLTSWGVPALTNTVLAKADRLKIVCHAAGSVKPVVTDALWERGIRVSSGAAAIAIDVAQTAVALMVISVKRIVPYSRLIAAGGWSERPYGPPQEIHGKTIGIIGASHVGRNVIRLLRNFDVGTILVADPYLSDTAASELGVRHVTLPELLAQADVVSCHAPSTAATRHLLNAENLRLLKNGAILINTSRGALIDEAALIAQLRTGRIYACLDVFDPEPPSPDSELRRLPNVLLTPHLAGCVSDCTRCGRFAVEDLRRFLTGEPPCYEVTKDMLDRVG